MSDFHDDSNAHEPDFGDASASWSEPARPASEPAKRARFDVAALAPWLPRLGATLWLERKGRRAHAPATVGARGLLILDHPALTPLARCMHANAHVQVTSHGPREWLSFRDAEGTAIAKLYLLPDTDYLAWDEMIAATGLAPPTKEPASWHAHAPFVRTALARLGAAWQARLVTFEHQSLPWLSTLGARAPLKLSLLGHELARLIAVSEGAELLTPLHAS
jgi:putative heme degradation protein